MDSEQSKPELVPVERLSAECSIHGTVPVVCPRCIGKCGGRHHKGTTWKRKQLHREMETARRLLRASPVLKAFIDEAGQLQRLCNTIGLSAEERNQLLANMISLDLAVKSADGEDD